MKKIIALFALTTAISNGMDQPHLETITKTTSEHQYNTRKAYRLEGHYSKLAGYKKNNKRINKKTHAIKKPLLKPIYGITPINLLSEFNLAKAEETKHLFQLKSTKLNTSCFSILNYFLVFTDHESSDTESNQDSCKSSTSETQ